MKKVIVIIFCLCFMARFASSHSYDVTGTDDNGRELSGTIESSGGQRSVEGELEDENGESHSFDGEWEGKGELSGTLDDGRAVELTTE